MKSSNFTAHIAHSGLFYADVKDIWKETEHVAELTFSETWPTHMFICVLFEMIIALITANRAVFCFPKHPPALVP